MHIYTLWLLLFFNFHEVPSMRLGGVALTRMWYLYTFFDKVSRAITFEKAMDHNILLSCIFIQYGDYLFKVQ